MGDSPPSDGRNAATHEPLRSGTRIRDYVIDRVLGNGGFGITYLARHSALERQVAIKEHFPREFAYRTGGTIRSTGANDEIYEWSRAKFLDEARTLARFDHPGIVKVLDVFEANGTAYMVQGFEAGQSLEKWQAGLKRRPTEAEIDSLLDPLLSALEAIHAQGLLHRDIAPDNIIIRSDGAPCLIDFGSARGFVGQRSQTLAVVKAGFSAPEQYASDARLQGPWTDIYALGATLYRLVTGRVPDVAPQRGLDEKSAMATASKEARGRYRDSLLHGIDAALALRPGERPQSVAAWRTMLQAKPMPGGAAETVPARTVKATSGTEFFAQGLPSALPGIPAFPFARAGAIFAAVLVAGLCAYWLYPSRGSATECDRLAASPTDSNRVSPGVEWQDLDGDATVAACVRALASATDRTRPRLQLQMGRGYERVKRFEEAARAYRAAATGGDPEAMSRLADLLYGGLGVPRDLVEACRLWETGAKAGNADAMANLAACYERGLGVTKRDRAAAVAWTKKAAQGGSLDAEVNLATSFDEEGVNKDKAEAVRRLTSASSRGAWFATYYLAERYETGDGVAKDEIRATQLYKEAAGTIARVAAANRGFAHFLLGLMHHLGRGFPVDHAVAARHFQQAADLGSHFALAWLGSLYENGQGVAQDVGRALRLYEAAVERGDNDALQNLALLYRDGKGVAKDGARARALLERAMAFGISSAIHELAYLHEQGIGGETNIAEALRLYRIAADRGVAASPNNIGDIYENGKGVPVDIEEAIRWYRRGVEKRDPSAMDSLGLLYQDGKGVRKDEAEALRWFREAAAGGLAVSMTRLGIAYREGRGVAKDFKEALKWFRDAAAKDDVEAINTLGVMYEQGEGIAVDLPKAAAQYLNAAQKGHAAAMYNYAALLEQGRGVGKDCNAARAWYQRSSSAGDEDAKKKLADGSLARCR